MGKSTTAKMFEELGCALWDADAAVHRLYGKNGLAVEPLRTVFPTAVIDDTISRDALRDIIRKTPDALKAIERIVHPLVAADRKTFIEHSVADIAVLDIPLLFETGSENQMDAVACVSVSPEEQEKRVLARGTMTREEFESIREKQMPNSEKCARSDFVIETDTLEHARAQVQAVVDEIRERLIHARSGT
jgi:dephospho-CoA kinase